MYIFFQAPPSIKIIIRLDYQINVDVIKGTLEPWDFFDLNASPVYITELFITVTLSSSIRFLANCGRTNAALCISGL